MSKLTPQEILHWNPKKWSDIVGNMEIIQLWMGFLIHGICNACFTGPSRTGKTRAITLGIKALCCTNRTEELNPCGMCWTCKALDGERHCHSGTFVGLTGGVHTFKAINCETVTEKELMDLHLEVDLDNPATILYLDEVAALGRRGLERLILKDSDEPKSTWIASAVKVKPIAKPKGEPPDREFLSVPMQGRFAVYGGTTVPSEAELTQWIKDRSQDWEIIIEDEELSIPLMIYLSDLRVGLVIHIFSAAASRGRRIDPDWLSGLNIGPQD